MHTHTHVHTCIVCLLPQIIAVSSSETATYNERGLDIPALRAHAADEVSLLKDFKGGEGEWG